MKDKSLLFIFIIVQIVVMFIFYSFGWFDGITLKRTVIVGEIKQVFDESIRTGKPFVFEGDKVRFVSKDDPFEVVYRVHQFIWPKDEEVLPMPINKFGQYDSRWRTGD